MKLNLNKVLLDYFSYYFRKIVIFNTPKVRDYKEVRLLKIIIQKDQRNLLNHHS